MIPVVVTGLGLSTSRGPTLKSTWNIFCPEQTQQPGASFALSKRSNVRGFGRAQELARRATREALEQAAMSDENIGCTFSASKPLFDGERIVPPDEINQAVAAEFKLLGERRNVVAACATGANAIALGASWIEQGVCDAVLAGSVEPYPHPLIAAGFRQMGVTSADGVTRPFDRRRSGFAFGEGAGAVVLESAAHARARGAKPLAVLSGWALGADSHSSFAFNSNGARIADVISLALARAKLAPQDVRHLNAHGTATRLNDWIETQAIQKAFGAHAEKLMISATKAATGHLLGASGSVEFVLTVLALRHQYVPPTETLHDSDPECPLDYTPGKGHPANFDHAMSLSFGFGGPIAALVVSRL